MFENHDLTEVGEPELVGDIDRRAKRLFEEIVAGPASVRHDAQFNELHDRLDQLIEMKRAAGASKRRDFDAHERERHRQKCTGASDPSLESTPRGSVCCC
jgi:hypothetical protein